MKAYNSLEHLLTFLIELPVKIKIEARIIRFEYHYSNEITAVAFLADTKYFNGGGTIPRVSFMSILYAHELVAQPDNTLLYKSFEYSLAHERGHYMHNKQDKFENKTLSRWVDETLSDIWGFQYMMKENNLSFDEAIVEYDSTINFKQRYRVEKDSPNLTFEEREVKIAERRKECTDDHPSWNNRLTYVQMSLTQSEEEIIEQVKTDYEKYRHKEKRKPI